MNRNQHSDEFRAQALSKVRLRGTRSVRDIADELNMSAGTLRKWLSKSNGAAAQPASTAELPIELPAQAWSAAQRLLALHQTHGLAGTELNTWCREKGLFEHQLVSWRDAFCAATGAPRTHPRSSSSRSSANSDISRRQPRLTPCVWSC